MPTLPYNVTEYSAPEKERVFFVQVDVRDGFELDEDEKRKLEDRIKRAMEWDVPVIFTVGVNIKVHVQE